LNLQILYLSNATEPL